MIHLEEYLDTLEALPMELQRQFTLMRELDALSQDIQGQMKKTTEEFVENPPTKDDPHHMEYMRNFIQLFSTVLKHGEEKVALATQTYDLVDKHIRKLDDDLARFEERQLAMPSRIPHSWGPPMSAQPDADDSRASVDRDRRPGGRRADDAALRKRRSQIRDGSPQQPGSTKSSTPSGRRTNGTRGASNVAVTARADASSRSRVTSKVVSDFAEMPIDPNEPRYCYCNQVSYGEMVACDNDNCEVEWFHLGCVDLKGPPEGTWYCRDCSQRFKKRREHRL
ncbi:hypothetical protein COEREDRAFT_102660 [Coemansia reversa NRRL 1564]|uniref:Chromatin modification-related protein n=1 Tax=Coemansia reversa (strain ATCC 12441 / NRRL 1564) TaxID=763665 RepID=A0A2G5BAP7_COERN|nr:hypothetical protein COEREDRAFT_102660 [Coemansia reversa NRRL 1564]|eukprot:PIA15787.1 hypothetical protein COEREDRAFT_102660 [Coemansia reversa NRRL 1564]